jgi:Chromosome segregation ATPases
MISESLKQQTVQRDEVQKRRLELEAAVVRAKGQLESAEAAKSSLLSEKESLQVQRDATPGMVHGGTNDLAVVEKAIEEKNQSITRIQITINEIADRLSDTGIPLLYEQREEAERQKTEIQRRLYNKEQEISEIRMELSFAQKSVEEERQQMERIREKVKQYDDEVRECQEEITIKERVISEAESTVAEFSQEIDDLRAERGVLSKKSDDFDLEVREFISKKDRVLLKIESMEEKSQILAQEISSLVEQAGDCVTDLTEDEIEIRVQKTTISIEKLGDVNMRAIEEYDQVYAVVTDRMSRVEILERELSDIKDRIEFFSKKKYEAFHEAFTTIDTNFRDIFSRLTMGTGELKLGKSGRSIYWRAFICSPAEG